MKLIINLMFYLMSYFTFMFKVIFNCLSLSYMNSLIYSFSSVFELIKSGYNLLVGEIMNGILSLYKYFKSFKKLVNIIMYIVISSYLYYKYLILTTVSTVKKIKEKMNTSKSFCFMFFLNLMMMSFLMSMFLMELMSLNIFSKGDDILVFFLSCCTLVLIVAATMGAISAISMMCFLIIKGSMQLAFNLYYFILEKSSLLYGFLQDKYSLGFTGLYSKICEYFKLKCKMLHSLLGSAACYVCSEFIKCWASFFDWLFNTFFFKHLNNLLNMMSYLFTIISEELKFIVLVTMSPIKSMMFLSIIYMFKPTFYKISSSNMYMNTFGSIEGVFYSFWLFHLKDSFNTMKFFMMDSVYMKPNSNLMSVTTNLMCCTMTFLFLMCCMYVYLGTMGLNTGVIFKVMIYDKWSIENLVLSGVVIGSYGLLYMASMFYFMGMMFNMMVLMVSMYSCVCCFYYSFLTFKGWVLGIYNFFKDMLEKKVKNSETETLSSKYQKLEDYFNYEHLFGNKLVEEQKKELDEKEKKKDEKMFFYKSLFINIMIALCIMFTFGLMFLAYVVF